MSKRFLLFYLLPTLLLLLAAVLTLVLGTHALYRRDVFNIHLPMKWVQAEAMKGGYLPLVDPARRSMTAHPRRRTLSRGLLGDWGFAPTPPSPKKKRLES